jgi:hypothetical protein
VRSFAFALAAAVAFGCSTTTPTPGPDPEGRDVDRISVSVVDAGRSRGVTVSYLVEADLATTSRAILSVEARPEESMIVESARAIRRDLNSGQFVIRFHRELGLQSDAIYRYRTDTTAPDEFRYWFRVSPANAAISWQVMGSYTARPEGKGCRVEYEFTSNYAALRRDQLMAMIRQDATAIMNHAETP